MWVVAEADEKFLPEEKQKMIEVLKEYGQIDEEDTLLRIDILNKM